MTKRQQRWRTTGFVTLVVALAAAGCGRGGEDKRLRATGYVEATEVRVAPEVGGRVLEMRVAEGDRVAAGDLIARLDTADAKLAVRRLQAERDQADAQLRLLLAGSRPKISARPLRRRIGSRRTSRPPSPSSHAAEADLQRFEALLRSNAGSRKQRDDAVDAAGRGGGACERGARARASGGRNGRAAAGRRAAAGDRRRARARVAAVDAQIASLAEDHRRRRGHGAGRRHRHVEAGRRRRDGRAAHSPSSSSPISITPGRTSTSTSRWCRSCRLGQQLAHRDRRRPAPERHDHVHLAEGGVHAAQRADGRRALEARVPHQGDGRQPRRRAKPGCRSKRSCC